MRTQTTFTPLPRPATPHLTGAGASRSRRCRGLLVGFGLAAFLSLGQSNAALAATAPPLGTLSTYGVVAETYTGNGAVSTISGNVCYTTGPGTFPPSIIGGGALNVPCTNGGDQVAALADLNSQACTPLGAAVALDSVTIGVNPPGTFPPGCYSSTGAMTVTTGATVTLSGYGVYIFRPGGTLDPAANSHVNVTAGACQADVYWAPNGATTIGANSSFVGSIFRGVAAGLSITLGNSSSLVGRAVAFGSTVTADTNTITVSSACSAPVPTVTLTKVSSGGVGTFGFTGSNGFSGQSITTLTSGTGVAGATQTLTAAGVSTTITESTPPPGYSLSSISCTGLGSGGAATPDLGNRTMTLNAAATAAGSAIACTFTNTVTGPLPPAGTAIPTLSEWALIMLAALMAVAGIAAVRQRKS